jgi:uncharacterized protein with gpF-like domain
MKPQTNEPRQAFIRRCVQSGNSPAECQLLYEPERRRQVFWKKIDRQRAGHLAPAQKKFGNGLKELFAQAAEQVKRFNSPAAIGGTDDLELEKTPLRKSYDQVWPNVGAKFAASTVGNLEKNHDSPLIFKEAVEEMTEQELYDYFTQVTSQAAASAITDRVFKVSETVKKDIIAIVQQAVKKGYSIDRTAKLIKDVSNKEIIPKRARRIARTEIISASNFGSLQGAKATKLDLVKEYIATRDGLTRAGIESWADHLSPDGQTVDLNEPFKVSGESLQYPGDPAGSPSNIINCRCTQGFVPK